MKRFVFVIVLMVSMAASAQSVRDTVCLNMGWQFRYDGEETWRKVDLPHDFQISQPWIAPSADERSDNSDGASNTRSRLSARAFKEMGTGWYQKVILPPYSWRNRRILLDFQGIMLVGDIFLNGERIGGTEYGYLGFEIDITGKLKYGQENIISVRAYTGKPENSRWYTGGGLYRDVNLILTPQDCYFVRHPLQITTRQDGLVCVKAEIYRKNAGKDKPVNIVLCIADDKGKVVTKHTSRVSCLRKSKVYAYELDSITIPQPKLWSCDTPYLYKAVVTILNQDGTVADQVSERFGIRTIDYSPEYGLKLNGKKVLLKGVANHHTLGALGAAAYPRAIEKRLQLLKSFGFNHIRTSHNPYSEDFMRLCDQYGILVVDELYDKWLTKFAGGRTEWTQLWQHDVEEWVKRDRNHPSVVMWSLGNELQTYSNLPYNDWGITPYRLMNTLLKRYDTTRPTTVAMHPRGRSFTTDSIPAPLAMETEIAAYNYRYMYFPGDGRRYPNMIFYQSEANTSGIPANYFGMDLKKVIGLAHWGAIDYLGESSGWPAKGWSQGLFNIALEPKPIAYHVKSYFSEEPTTHIGIVEQNLNEKMWNGVQVGTANLSENWNRTEGDTVTVCVFTNADEAELVLNGHSLGRKKNPTDIRKRNCITWERVPYHAGTINAIGYHRGNAVSHHLLQTTENAVALQMTADNEHWTSDGMDLQHVRITAVDKNGRKTHLTGTPVTVTLEGDARLIAVSNGDINTDDTAESHQIQLYDGTALAIVRAGKQNGKVTMAVEASGMRGCQLKLKYQERKNKQ